MSSNRFGDLGYVISSKYRVEVVEALAENPQTPTQIAGRLDQDSAIAHVSRALRTLREKDMVELLVPEERSKGRIYGLTDKGEDVVEDGRETNAIEPVAADGGETG